MSDIDEVQVNVKVKDAQPADLPVEEDEDSFIENPTDYGRGVLDGYCQAVSEVLGRIYENFADIESVRDVLFPELCEAIQSDNFHEALISHVFSGESSFDEEQLLQLGSDLFEEREERNQEDALKMDPHGLGKRGEEAAARYLARRGYEILERNWICDFGEADIIAEDEDGTIVFVEVKTRRGAGAGMPEEAITRKKQRKYENIALCYLTAKRQEDNTPVRFDAIGICVNGSNRAMLRHHKGFFDALR